MDAYQTRPERRAVELDGYVLLADGSTVKASLLDLSYEGCRIGCEQALEPGSRVKLSVFRLGLIDAQVRWYQDGEAGLTFAPKETTERPHWPRRSRRVSVTARVTLRKPGKPNFDAKVFDVSPEGCKVEFIDRPSVGDLVFIKFDGLETLDAEVCWVEDNVMGLNFAKSFHPAVFDVLVQRLGAGA